MKVLITGANGFIGKNLLIHLRERKNIEILIHTKEDSLDLLSKKIAESDFIFHLAGINRPIDENEFILGNVDFTKKICKKIEYSGRIIPIVFTSSIQAELDNPYGKSKSAAEVVLQDLSKKTGCPVFIYRLPNVFGKWCRPNYNSVVATFCNNIVQDLPIKVNDPFVQMKLVYVDDVISSFFKVLDSKKFHLVQPEYSLTVGELESILKAFKSSRKTGVVESVGSGLVRALYSTYITYYKPEQFSYPLVKHEDPRGFFAEILKTKDSGQFSFFTAHKGITRGGHYHHSKNEKFLVVKGSARFCFKNLITDEFYELFTSDQLLEVVETIPGWTHDITNIGEEEMLVIIWANEIFDRNLPDTYASKI